jgi:hypothetical protein
MGFWQSTMAYFAGFLRELSLQDFQAAILSRSSLFLVFNPRSAIVRRPHLLHHFQAIIRKALAKTGHKIALCTGFSKMEKNVHFIVADRADKQQLQNGNWHNLFKEDSVSVSCSDFISVMKLLWNANSC